MISCSGAILFSKKTGRVLLLQKQHGKHAGRWVLVGGTAVEGETPWQSLVREIKEEIGECPDILKTLPVEKFVSSDSAFNFTTYFCVVEEEFIPKLSDEHLAWGWFNLDALPKPTHRSLEISLNNPIIKEKLKSILTVVNII